MVLTGVVATTAAATGDIDVVIPFPALFFLVVSLMCQQYADLTVLGMARRELELRVNREFPAPAMLYETHIAPIRKGWPGGKGRYVGLTVLQILAVGLPALGGLAAACAAISNETTWAKIAFGVATAICAASGARSYYEMLKTPAWAAVELKSVFDRQGQPPPASPQAPLEEPAVDQGSHAGLRKHTESGPQGA